MVTNTANHRESASRWPVPRVLAVALMIVSSVFAIVQSGLIQPHALVDRLPDELVPEFVRDHIGEPEPTMLSNAYVYQQQRALSCEYASTTIAATMGGWNISEYSFDPLVPLNENPHYGYRGNIHGEWGNTTDYGIYPEPLHTALNEMGIPSTVIYAEGDANVLRNELTAGNAVVVWLAMRGPVNSFDVQSADGSVYQLTQYMHVMTAYGFDESGVYLADPGTSVWQFYAWPAFMDMWNVMDGMALSVQPASISATTDTFLTERRYR